MGGSYSSGSLNRQMFSADIQWLMQIIFWYTNGIYYHMLLALSNMTSFDLQLGILAVVGSNLVFITALSLLSDVREKLMSRLIGF